MSEDEPPSSDIETTASPDPAPQWPRIAYAEFATTTNFSFLRGASHPGDLLIRALELGHGGIGIADRNSVAGVVRALSALRQQRQGAKNDLIKTNKIRKGLQVERLPSDPPILDLRTAVSNLRACQLFRLVVGARLAFQDDSPDILVYPENRVGWGRLCRLLTVGNRKARKGECKLSLDDLLLDTEGLLLVVMPGRRPGDLAPLLPRIARDAPGRVWLGAAMHRRGNDRRRLARLIVLAAKADVPLIAVNDVLYHAPEQRDLQDVLTCVREGETIETIGRRLEVNAERHLKSPREMARLFQDAPEAVAETQHLLARIDFSLKQLKYEYPEEPTPPGWMPQNWLEHLTWRRAEMHYREGIPEEVGRQLREELKLIKTLDYARYFLTIYEIVRVANDKGILCQGRGSAANSAVCFMLGITSVDPKDHKLLFARFISTERQEPPDIDVDFEHERREIIMQHIYERYGRERAGIAATVISYRPRSAIRDVGKALGLTEDVTAKLAATVWGSWGAGYRTSQVLEAGLDPANPTVRRAVELACRLIGFPRHLSQHVGGYVLARGRLDEIVPIGNAAMPDRTFIEWDKDDIDELGLMKVDILALGMLTCIRKAFDLIRIFEGDDYTIATLPQDEKDVYDMLCEGESIGVFQVESRAQINMLPRLRPRNFYDLAIQVAIVRPGPIQGDMVHPYLKRRQGREEATYPRPAPPHDPDELRNVLGRTLGVPLFQEQAMKLAMVAAEFTPEEANQLRRAMATFRNVGTIGTFETKMVERMVARGYEREFAAGCFGQIKGFGTYGFPESHAVSFAKLVYASSFIKCRHPAIFACALLNSQPMGFYAPAQIVRDAQKNGIEVRAPDINLSHWDNTIERLEDGALALQLGFRRVDGMTEEWAGRLVEARGRSGDFVSVEALARRARLPNPALRHLADADAFRSIGLDRRQALWAVRQVPDDAPLPLFAAANAYELGEEPDARLPDMALGEHVATDYQTLRLSLKAHPMQILRPVFASERILSCAATAARPDGAFARTAGIVLVRQRPGKGNAIFVTLEDETGVTNVVLWARDFERYRREVMSARLLLVEGRVQKSPEGVIHLMGVRVHDRTAELKRLLDDTPESPPGQKGAPGSIERALSLPAYPPGSQHPRNVRILPRSRDFH